MSRNAGESSESSFRITPRKLGCKFAEKYPLVSATNMSRDFVNRAGGVRFREEVLSMIEGDLLQDCWQERDDVKGNHKVEFKGLPSFIYEIV